MKKKFEHLIVISLDSLSSFDVERMKDLPNFRKLIKGSFFCPYVKTVYPSLTYPIHVSIITGETPSVHGVTANTFKQYNSSNPDWFWQREFIKCDTLFDLAKANQMDVAAILWPVTAKAEIKYNMPEIFSNKKWQNQIMVSLINGSSIFQIEMILKYGKIIKGKRQPELDNFVQKVVTDLIKNKKPELILAHFTDIDTNRHLFGNRSEEADLALERHDRRLGELLMLLKKEKMLDNTALVVLGDHASLDTKFAVKLNPALETLDFIKTDGKGCLLDYEFVVKSCGGSAYVYENPRRTKSEGRRVQLIDFLGAYVEKGIIESILDNKKAAAMGADPECFLMLEAHEGYYFLDGFIGDVLEETEGKSAYGSHFTLSNHGYSYEKKNYGTVFSVTTDLRSMVDGIKEEAQDKPEDQDTPESLRPFLNEEGELEGMRITDEFNVLKELLGINAV